MTSKRCLSFIETKKEKEEIGGSPEMNTRTQSNAIVVL
jgi:hypothetical protein